MESGGGGDRRPLLSRQMPVLNTSNLQENLLRNRDEENGRDSLAGLTIGAVIGYEKRPEPVQINRTLMDIIRDEESRSLLGHNNKKNWKSFKDRLRLSRATAAWSSSSPFQAGPSTGNSTPIPTIVQPENSSNAPESTSASATPIGGAAEDGVVESVTSAAPAPEPVRISLMALLEETDRQAGVAGFPLMAADEEGEEEEEEEEEGGGGEYSCCVCMVRHKGAAFIPCGHTFCRLCSRELWVSRGNCPLCNGFILEILDIF